MKQKDIALVILAAGVAAVLSLFLSNLLLSGPKNRQLKVEVVEPITADFSPPDSRYFSVKSNNPTKVITIGDSDNPNLFNSTQ